MKQKLIGLLAIMLVFSFGMIGCDWLFDDGDGGDDDINYTVEANGSSGSVPSTTLTFVFDDDVTITANDITITNGTGTVTKGNLNGSGKSYTLGITVTTAGNISVSINKTGISSAAKSVTVHKETEVTGGEKSLKITGFGSNHENYHYEINMFENYEDIETFFHMGSESLSKLWLSGKISGGLISKELLEWDYELEEYKPFTGTGPYFIFLQVFDILDPEESGYPTDFSYYISEVAVSFSAKDTELLISDFEGWDPWGNGGGDGPFTVSGTITGTGYTYVSIVIYHDDHMWIGSVGVYLEYEDYWEIIGGIYEPLFLEHGSVIWGVVSEWDDDLGPINPRTFNITPSYNGESYFDNIDINLDTLAYG